MSASSCLSETVNITRNEVYGRFVKGKSAVNWTQILESTIVTGRKLWRLSFGRPQRIIHDLSFLKEFQSTFDSQDVEALSKNLGSATCEVFNIKENSLSFPASQFLPPCNIKVS